MAISASAHRTAEVPGAERMTITDVTFDNSYAEGGEKVTPSDLQLTRVDFAICNLKNGSESETVTVSGAWYEISKELLHLHDFKAGKELAKEKDASKVVVRVFAFGK